MLVRSSLPVMLNLFQHPSLGLRGRSLEARWTLKRVQGGDSGGVNA
jgi:hypothetical protein